MSGDSETPDPSPDVSATSAPTGEPLSTIDKQNAGQEIPVRDAEQIRRARVLLRLSEASADADEQFVQLVGALHLARSVPEYWFTTAHQASRELSKSGREANELEKQLRMQLESIFSDVRRFQLVTELRQWDFHWEPLVDARRISPNCQYGRGAPMHLTTGPNKGSSVAYVGGQPDVISTGSGRRIGRTNYYQVQQSRYVDFESSEVVPLKVAIAQFLDDLPGAIVKVLEVAEVRQYIQRCRPTAG